ncbi:MULTISPECIES: CYTH domain-containing protein [Bacillaceae]|uniref:CYTH domain-containing protein n=1 Tax=Evansella alkalicola TaxID=745819 RepID=A0ABS6JZX5_9BACI|nr:MULTISPECIES: CYTH domain-containing protein [Bacillaceae]MBU9723631.1 CYTH domain-containing protein [Bacillus alkalicola]
MQQEVEIEFKNLLTESEFYQLKTEFSIDQKDFKNQINYYFETPNMELKKHSSALRIRKKGNNFVLTLKEPHPDGLLETHQKCSEEETLTAINNGALPSGDVVLQIEKLLNKSSLTFKFLGELQTERAEVSLEQGLLVLDKSSYLDVSDFELEFECGERKAGEQFFHELLRKFDIPLRKTPNKIKRFYDRKMNLL